MRGLAAIACALMILSGCVTEKAKMPGEDDWETAHTDSNGIGSTKAEDETMKEEGEEAEGRALEGRTIPHTPNQTFMLSTEEMAMNAIVHGMCWDEEECDLTPTNPKEKTLSDARLIVDQGQELVIHMIQNPGDFSNSHYPLQFELIEFRFNDEEGTVIDAKPGSHTYQFTAPDEVGTYFYLLHVLWDEERTKQVYYGFSLYVKE